MGTNNNHLHMGSHESTNNHGDFDVVPERTNTTTSTSTKHVHFTPEKSRISEEALEEWKEAPLNGDLTQIPGVGKVSAPLCSGRASRPPTPSSGTSCLWW